MRGHADAATLAAFREELLSARKAAQVSAHLAACPRCAALEAQLAEVTTMLSRTTAPPMPDALTARIEAALAAEAAARGAGTAAAPEPVPALSGVAAQDGGTPSANGHRTGNETARRTGWRGRDRSWLALRIGAVTAAVAVIAGGGYGVAQLLSGSTTGSAAGTQAAAPGAKRPAPGPSISGLHNAPASGAGGGTHTSIGVMTPLVLRSGTNYQPGTLGARASSVLKQLSHRSPIPNAAPAQKQSSLFPHLQACLIHIAPDQRPQLVDLARYQGHPALIVVLPATHSEPQRAEAIAPGCDSATAKVLATAPLPPSR